MAEPIIAEELKRWRWQEAGLRTQPRGDAEKVALAARLRAETTTCLPCLPSTQAGGRQVTVEWIAERLGMGTRGYLNHLLYRQRKSGGKQPLSRTPLRGRERELRSLFLNPRPSLP